MSLEHSADQPAAERRGRSILTTEAALLERLRSARAAIVTEQRMLVAVVGAPGAGKSTLAANLAAQLSDAIVVPMDGFHLDDALLEPRGLLPVKGSPHTFDAAGLTALLCRLRQEEGVVYAPVFDRERELSRAAATCIEPSHRTIIVEGNYLLLEEKPWFALAASFDLTIMLDVDEAVLRERLISRWTDLGLTLDAAVVKAESNDLPNGVLVRQTSRVADILYVQP